MITIKTEKIVVRCEQKRKITGIDLLEKDDLPTEYTEGECVWQDDGDLDLNKSTGKENYYLSCKNSLNIISDKELQKRLATIRRCGTRLQEINARLAKENADWHGEETFVI